jgi:hypothetical protein
MQQYALLEVLGEACDRSLIRGHEPSARSFDARGVPLDLVDQPVMVREESRGGLDIGTRARIVEQSRAVHEQHAICSAVVVSDIEQRRLLRTTRDDNRSVGGT